MILPWIQHNIHTVESLSRINVWNTQSQENEEIYFARHTFKMFWVIVIIQYFVILLLNFLN